MKSSILYDRILRSHIIPFNNSDTSISVDINSLSKSLEGVLLIFMKERSATKLNQDTEEFFNPKITKVEVTSGGSRLVHKVSGTQSRFPNLNENGEKAHFCEDFSDSEPGKNFAWIRHW